MSITSILKYKVHRIKATQYGAALVNISFQYEISNFGITEENLLAKNRVNQSIKICPTTQAQRNTKKAVSFKSTKNAQ